jgi:hypothetical protein
MVHVGAFLGFRKTECEAAKIVSGHDETSVATGAPSRMAAGRAITSEELPKKTLARKRALAS